MPADSTGATSVPCVWAAGNVANLTEQVIGAASAVYAAPRRSTPI
jgi:thioredoxin reductase